MDNIKKVIIIGAAGSLARVVTETLSNDQNLALTLFVRDKRKIENTYAAHVTEGDATNLQQLKEAISGQDIVYVNLAGDLELMGNRIIKAMQDTGVRRIIVITSIGIYQKPLKPVLIPYRKLADLVEQSGLIYTILRPDWFTNGNEIDYVLTQKGDPETGTAISRKSIADFILKLIRNPKMFTNSNLGISRKF